MWRPLQKTIAIKWADQSDYLSSNWVTPPSPSSPSSPPVPHHASPLLPCPPLNLWSVWLILTSTMVGNDEQWANYEEITYIWIIPPSFPNAQLNCTFAFRKNSVTSWAQHNRIWFIRDKILVCSGTANYGSVEKVIFRFFNLWISNF